MRGVREVVCFFRHHFAFCKTPVLFRFAFSSSLSIPPALSLRFLSGPSFFTKWTAAHPRDRDHSTGVAEAAKAAAEEEDAEEQAQGGPIRLASKIILASAAAAEEEEEEEEPTAGAEGVTTTRCSSTLSTATNAVGGTFEVSRGGGSGGREGRKKERK